MPAAAQEADRLSQLRTQQPDDFAGEVLEDVLDDVMDEVGPSWGRGCAAAGGWAVPHLPSPVPAWAQAAGPCSLRGLTRCPSSYLAV